jgi:hypothetical protein
MSVHVHVHVRVRVRLCVCVCLRVFVRFIYVFTLLLHIITMQAVSISPRCASCSRHQRHGHLELLLT